MLNRPFNQLTEGQLRKGIKEKFGSIAKFASISGINKWTIYKRFNGQRDQDSVAGRLALYMDAKTLKNRDTRLTRDDRNKIRMAVLSHPDSMKKGRQMIKNFCERHGFHASWLSNVLSTANENKQLARGSEFQRLLKILNIKL